LFIIYTLLFQDTCCDILMILLYICVTWSWRIYDCSIYVLINRVWHASPEFGRCRSVPLFKLTRDLIASLLFFLGSFLQQYQYPPIQICQLWKSTEICRKIQKLSNSKSLALQLLLLKFSLKLNILSVILKFNKRKSCMYLLHASFISCNLWYATCMWPE
jgi:hypothetical protein